MSRVGKAPINVPEGVSIKIEKRLVTVESKNGKLAQRIESDGISFKQEGSQLVVERATDSKRHKAMHGLYRMLVANMVEGVSKGFKKELELHGIGFRAENRGQLLTLQLGYSHPVIFLLPDEVKLETETKKGDVPRVRLSSIDKQLLGQVAAKIRDFRRPEPYKGKGIRYSDEYVRRKQGKTASK